MSRNWIKKIVVAVDTLPFTHTKIHLLPQGFTSVPVHHDSHLFVCSGQHMKEKNEKLLDFGIFWQFLAPKFTIEIDFSNIQNLNFYVKPQSSIFLVFWKIWIIWYFWHFLKKIWGDFFEIQNLNFYVKPQSSISLVFWKIWIIWYFWHFLKKLRKVRKYEKSR